MSLTAGASTGNDACGATDFIKVTSAVLRDGVVHVHGYRAKLVCTAQMEYYSAYGDKRSWRLRNDAVVRVFRLSDYSLMTVRAKAFPKYATRIAGEDVYRFRKPYSAITRLVQMWVS